MSFEEKPEHREPQQFWEGLFDLKEPTIKEQYNQGNNPCKYQINIDGSIHEILESEQQ